MYEYFVDAAFEECPVKIEQVAAYVVKHVVVNLGFGEEHVVFANDFVLVVFYGAGYVLE